MRNLSSHKLFRFSWLILPLLILALMNIPALASLLSTVISGLSPYPDGGNPNDAQAVTQCNGYPQFGVLYRNSETEPHLAVNPTNPDNMIAAWHQDRWSNGGAQGLGAAYTMDGGLTWTQVTIPFSRCSGGQPRSAGDYERASDPWISFSPDGTAHYMALVANFSENNRNGMTVASSRDGGATWSAPVAIKASPAKDPVFASPFHDKNTLTADPFNSRLVYATWTLFRLGSTTLVFSRSTDGGQTWNTRPVDNIEVVAHADLVVFRQGAQIVVLPNGTLVNAFFRILFNQSTGQVRLDQAIFRSYDQGQHWEKADVPVSEMFSTTAIDPELGIPVRDAQELPDIAVNRQTGDLYIVWQDVRFNNGLVGVVISHSSDGGSTWSDPVEVNQVPGVQAFLPVVASADDGTVGVLYYDFRNDTLGDAELSTDVFLAKFDSDLNFINETRLTSPSFDLRQSVITGSRGYFPGDYVGLDTAGDDFVAAYTVTNPLGLPVVFPQNNSGLFLDSHNRQDIRFTRVTP
jgi:hypothetical protein